VDAKGKFCPIPLVLLGKALKEVPSQGVVMISATDPGFLPDLFSWIQTRPYEVVAIRIEGGIFRAWVKKGDPLEGFPPG
jgi:TusA-related sulfurtransferase